MTAELEKMRQKVKHTRESAWHGRDCLPHRPYIGNATRKIPLWRGSEEGRPGSTEEGMLLNDVKVIDCMRMKVHENGKGLVKVQLESPNVLKRCTAAGKNLNKSKDEDLRCVARILLITFGGGFATGFWTRVMLTSKGCKIC